MKQRSLQQKELEALSRKVVEMEQKRIDKKQQITLRLTLRVPEELDKLIREEAVRRGTNMNQTMLHILHQYFNQK